MRHTAAVVLAALLLAYPTSVLAHSADRGFVLLLPTGYYRVGGGLAVAASLLILAFLPPRPLERFFDGGIRLFAMWWNGRAIVSSLSFLGLAGLVAAGFLGSRDPLSNPLPLTVWTLFWIGLTLLHGIVGNLWAWLNPWYGPYRLVTLLARRDPDDTKAVSIDRFGCWPAIPLFIGFVWFELVYPAPEDPAILATIALAYWAATFAAMLVFGFESWSRTGEFFSVFFEMIAKIAIFAAERSEIPPPFSTIRAGFPGFKAVAAQIPPTSGILFLLVGLGSVSFDGLMRTFAWLDFIGVNPLEFPGRSEVVLANSLGLAGMIALLAGAYFLAVFFGNRLAGSGASFSDAAGKLVWSIAPIALAYHFSHYLAAFLVNGQYALAALSDPLSNGWNLFGTAGLHVSAGITAGPRSAMLIWNAQAAAIVAGHVLAVLIAHVIAFRLHGSAKKATLSQIPLGLLMVAYTVFGLWLLSSPTA